MSLCRQEHVAPSPHWRLCPCLRQRQSQKTTPWSNTEFWCLLVGSTYNTAPAPKTQGTQGIRKLVRTSGVGSLIWDCVSQNDKKVLPWCYTLQWPKEDLNMNPDMVTQKGKLAWVLNPEQRLQATSDCGKKESLSLPGWVPNWLSNAK